MKNLLTAWSRLFIGALYEAGVRDFVLAPGSRNTSLIVAACRHAGARTHSILDERAAAFFALGQARVTGRPTAVLCTSGTAGAHFYPAVLEAEAAGLPLIVVTADRPPELIDVGAPQAMDQRELFGRHVRAEIDLGVPDAHPQALDGVARSAARAVFAAASGPVHVNFRARKPLEPYAAETDEERALERAVDERLARMPRFAGPRPAVGEVATLRAALAECERPLFVAGPMRTRVESIATLAARVGAPLVADVASQLRREGAITTGDVSLVNGDLTPDLIVRFGAPPTGTVWPKFFARHRDVATVVVDATPSTEPYGGAVEVIVGDIAATTEALLDAAPRERDAWCARFEALESNVRRAIEALPWSEATVTRRLVAHLPSNAAIVAGNSLAIRHLDLYATPFAQPVLHQRGVNGIDGSLAGTAGAASAHDGPIAALIGDVTFAHDIGSLALLARVERPVVVVVVDNGGGRIFEMLPLMETDPPPEVFDRFLTPPQIDVGRACSAFGVGYRSVEDRSALDAALAEAFTASGATVVHAIVPPSDAAKILKRLRDEVRS